VGGGLRATAESDCCWSYHGGVATSRLGAQARTNHELSEPSQNPFDCDGNVVEPNGSSHNVVD
jgi:hypothetical protein